MRISKNDFAIGLMRAIWHPNFGRSQDISYEKAASAALPVAEDLYRAAEHLKDTRDGEADSCRLPDFPSDEVDRFSVIIYGLYYDRLKAFHNAAIQDKLWSGNHEDKFKRLPEEMRLNYSILFLSSIFAQNVYNPPERIVINERRSCEYWMIRTWLSRFKMVTPDKQLNWSSTVDAVIEVFEGLDKDDKEVRKGILSHKYLDDLTDPGLIRELCIETHKLMTERNLWGADSYIYKRVDFDKLPPHMKDNYLLIVLTLLAAESERNDDYGLKAESEL